MATSVAVPAAVAASVAASVAGLAVVVPVEHWEFEAEPWAV